MIAFASEPATALLIFELVASVKEDPSLQRVSQLAFGNIPRQPTDLAIPSR